MASAAAAQQAVAGLDQELDRIERRYRVEHARLAQQQAQRPASRRSQAGRQAQDRPPPDLKKLRALTEAQASATGATRQPPPTGVPAQGENTDGARSPGHTHQPQTGGPKQPQPPQLG